MLTENTGRPPGYDQTSPFQSTAKPAGQVPQEKNPTGAGSGTPMQPTDPTMAGWRTAAPTRQLGDPHGNAIHQMGQEMSPLQQAIAGPAPSGMSAAPSFGSAGASATGALAPPAAPPMSAVGQQSSFPQSDHDRLGALLQKYHSTDNPGYWDQVAADHGGFDKTGAGWLEDRIMRGDGSALVKSGQVQKVQAQHNPNQNAFMAMGAQQPAGLMANTGSNNPLIAAIMQSLQQKQQVV